MTTKQKEGHRECPCKDRRTRIDRILDWPNGFWSTWTYLFKHTKRTPFVKPRGFGQSEFWSNRCLPSLVSNLSPLTKLYSGREPWSSGYGRRLASNPGPLVSKSTALSTLPQPTTDSCFVETFQGKKMGKMLPQFLTESFLEKNNTDGRKLWEMNIEWSASSLLSRVVDGWWNNIDKASKNLSFPLHSRSSLDIDHIFM